MTKENNIKTQSFCVVFGYFVFHFKMRDSQGPKKKKKKILVAIMVISHTLEYSACAKVETLDFFFTLMNTVEVNNKNKHQRTRFVPVFCF